MVNTRSIRKTLKVAFYYGTGSGLDDTDNEAASFEVTTQSLDTEFDGTRSSLTRTARSRFDSNRGTYSLNVNADGDLDDEQLEELFNDDFNVNADSVGDDDDD